MSSFNIYWKLSAEKDIRDIERQQINRIIAAVENLASNPFPPQHRKLKGVEALYRIKVGSYRVIYQVDMMKKTITIVYIRHRKTAYRNL